MFVLPIPFKIILTLNTDDDLLLPCTTFMAKYYISS